MGELVAVAEALFDFKGLRADNLHFKRGDVITVLEMNDNGWWKGCDAEGNVGIFPYNYVELRDSVGTSFPLVRALYDFSAQGEGQLSFKKGDMITLTKEISVDWWQGKLRRTGDQGIFPANRVERTEMNDEEAAKEEKKRFSLAKKEKQHEADKAVKERASLQRKEAKQKDEKEKERLHREALEASERARRAEEELARVKAEAELLKRQAAEAEAKRSSRTFKAVTKTQEQVRQQARRSVERFKGQSPGPPPEMDPELAKYKSPQADPDLGKWKKPEAAENPPSPPQDKFRRSIDDMFGPAPPVQVPKPGDNKFLAEIETKPPEQDKGKLEEPEAELVNSKKSNFKYNAKFQALGGGNKCAKCDKTVGFADKVAALGKMYHKECFRCSTCSMVLRQGEWCENNNNPYCRVCHTAGFGPKGFGHGQGMALGVEIGKTAGSSTLPRSAKPGE
jgi:hypothetical protein